jgi:hypothetical protein
MTETAIIECKTKEVRNKLLMSLNGKDLTASQRILFKRMFRVNWVDDWTVEVIPKGSMLSSALTDSGASILNTLESSLLKEGFLRKEDYEIRKGGTE